MAFSSMLTLHMPDGFFELNDFLKNTSMVQLVLFHYIKHYRRKLIALIMLAMEAEHFDFVIWFPSITVGLHQCQLNCNIFAKLINPG